MEAGLVAKGREAEMDFLQKDLGAWSYDKIENCVRETGKQPMTWVDINKGDDMRPNVRCRLCVQETKRRSPMDIVDTFSATPPYEALRLMVSMTMTPRNIEEANHVLLFVDITRAHPHCLMTRKLWIKLPSEDPRSNEEGVCGLLERSMYGCRDAGQNFELLVRHVMVDILGFVGGMWSACVFEHEKKQLTAYVYGDNFTVKGTRDEVEKFLVDLSEHMVAKKEGILGPNKSLGDVQEITCLNKIFRWVKDDSGEAIEIEADPRHVEIICAQMKLAKTSKAVVTPGVKTQEADLGKDLHGDEQTAFRSVVMRANYLAEGRPDIRYATKEAARLMSQPCELGIDMLKRLARYLAGVPRLVHRFEKQRPPGFLIGYSDSDHAGCLRTRRSTSCAVIMYGKHMIKFLSATQKVEALSSAESEWYALVRTASVAIGVTNLAKDLGLKVDLRLAGDATAASGIAHRRGAGRVRHIEAGTLWLQRLVVEKIVTLSREPGSDNVADLGTKHVDATTLNRIIGKLGYVKIEGRSTLALRASLNVLELATRSKLRENNFEHPRPVWHRDLSTNGAGGQSCIRPWRADQTCTVLVRSCTLNLPVCIDQSAKAAQEKKPHKVLSW